MNKHSGRGAVGLAKLVQTIDTEQASEPKEEQPKKKDTVEILNQAWIESGKPCVWNDVLKVFADDLNGENNYTLDALIAGIKTNIRAGILQAA